MFLRSMLSRGHQVRDNPMNRIPFLASCHRVHTPMSTQEKSSCEDPADVIWSTYLDAACDEDKTRPKNWEGNTGGILTFVRNCILLVPSTTLT